MSDETPAGRDCASGSTPFRPDGGRASEPDGEVSTAGAGGGANGADGRGGGLTDADAADLQRSRDPIELELERLRERNERLRENYARARQAQYRRAALGLALLGVVALAGAAYCS